MHQAIIAIYEVFNGLPHRSIQIIANGEYDRGCKTKCNTNNEMSVEI